MKKLLLVLAALSFPLCDACAQLIPTRPTVVELTASTQGSVPHITLAWDAEPAATSLSVWRRLSGSSTWALLANLPVADTGYADMTAQPGTLYEYRVKRLVPPTEPVRVDADQFGFIAAAHDLPLVESRGRVIVVVDNTHATPLAAELAQLRTDLAGDGWTVLYRESARQHVGIDATGSGAARLAEVNGLKNQIRADYTASPANTRAVFLLGRLPIPFSGVIVPDGHDAENVAHGLDNHQGAWPADGFYADMDGVWTDTTKNWRVNPAIPRRHNLPGDGKFDQDVYPSALELEVGRVDLADMTTVPSGVSEVVLLQRYLERDHLFRHNSGRFENVPRRALIEDQFGVHQEFDPVLQRTNHEVFAGSGWRNGIAWFGRNDTNLLRWEDEIYVNRYLFAYGCGGGSYDGASGVAYNSVLANNDSHAVFTQLLGSYFGEWSYPNCFLRAPLAGTAGSMGLTCEWAGRPHYYHPHMALGETIGHGTRLSQNNTEDQFDPVGQNRGVHMALMGDPTLRLHSVSPISALTVAYEAAAQRVNLAWTASPDGAVLGYHVFRGINPSGPLTRITGAPANASLPHGAPITTTTFTDSSPIAGRTNYYFVRAVKREVSASGSYFNMSTGIPANAAIPGAPKTPPVAVNDAATAESGVAITVNAIANDSSLEREAFAIVSLTQPSHGVALMVPGGIRYTSEAGYTGVDSLTYTVQDRSENTATATVDFTVNAKNRPPVAAADSAQVARGAAITVNVLANDSDPDGDPVAVVSATQGIAGVVGFSSTGITYRAKATGSATSDRISYTIRDSRGATATAQVSISITGTQAVKAPAKRVKAAPK